MFNLHSLKRTAQPQPHNSNNMASVIKQGKLLFYEVKASQWKETDVKLLKNSVFEYTIGGKINKIVMKPSVTASPTTKANFLGTFVINTVPETYHNHGPMFSAQDPQEGERWMHIINLQRLKNNLELVHKHPLTLCSNTVEENNKDCTSPSVLRGVTVSCAGCGVMSDAQEGYRCEFCNFDLCGECKRSIDNIHTAMYTSAHHPHSLVKFPKALNPMWFSSDYNGTFNCDQCKEHRTGTVYHCVECGTYDECEYCGIEAKKQQDNTVNPAAEMSIDLGHMPATVLKREGNTFSLSSVNAKKAPQATTVIANKPWDLSTIDEATPSNAYFEVTFHKFNFREGKVSVGIGNQIFVQNQLLGYQQNSFGYFNTGTVLQNVGTNGQQYPTFTVGDTIGAGIVIDSFNQRRLYFTKNGQLLDFFQQRIHIGMDCFPGVSFTKGSGVQFEVKLAGPFKFDVNSLPNYRPDRENRFEKLPQEIIATCYSYAATRPSQVALFSKVSKRSAEAAANNLVWRPLYLQLWPRQNAKLNVKSWKKMYQRRAEVESVSPLARSSRNMVENCNFEFECPLLWETMKPGQKEGERNCDKCKKTVYEVNDEDTMQRYIEMGRCVTFIFKARDFLVPPMIDGPRLLGLPPMMPKPVPKPYQNATVRETRKIPDIMNPDLLEDLGF